MRISINFTDLEVEMLKGWQGQCSDGVGENKPSLNPYWKNLNFDISGIIVDTNVKAFRDKSEQNIIDKVCEKFIDVTEEGMNILGIGELYFNVDKRDNEILAQKTANSIIAKLGGDKDYFEVDTPEERMALQIQRARMYRNMPGFFSVM